MNKQNFSFMKGENSFKLSQPNHSQLLENYDEKHLRDQLRIFYEGFKADKGKFDEKEFFEILVELLNNGYIVNGHLGSGSFGQIFTAQKNDNVYAIKCQKREGNDIEKEGKIAQMLNNKEYIHQFLGGFSSYDGKYFFFVSERLCCDLKVIIEKMNTENKKPTYNQIIALGIQFAKALNALKQSNIMHFDIKPDNVFYDFIQKCIKIGDFGISMINSNIQQSHTNKLQGGTYKYWAPEIRKKLSSYGYRTDIYSIGIVILEFILGRLISINEALSIYLDSKNLINLLPQDKQFEQLNQIILKMLEIDRAKRIHAEELLKSFINLKEQQESLFQEQQKHFLCPSDMVEVLNVYSKSFSEIKFDIPNQGKQIEFFRKKQQFQKNLSNININPKTTTNINQIQSQNYFPSTSLSSNNHKPHFEMQDAPQKLQPNKMENYQMKKPSQNQKNSSHHSGTFFQMKHEIAHKQKIEIQDWGQENEQENLENKIEIPLILDENKIIDLPNKITDLNDQIENKLEVKLNKNHPFINLLKEKNDNQLVLPQQLTQKIIKKGQDHQIEEENKNYDILSKSHQPHSNKAKQQHIFFPLQNNLFQIKSKNVKIKMENIKSEEELNQAKQKLIDLIPENGQEYNISLFFIDDETSSKNKNCSLQKNIMSQISTNIEKISLKVQSLTIAIQNFKIDSKGLFNAIQRCKNSLTEFNLKLTQTDLGYTQIQLFSQSLVNCVNIKVLSLHIDQGVIDSNSFSLLMHTIKELKRIISLNLIIKLKIGFDGSKSLAEALKGLVDIKKLGLSLINCEMKKEGVQQLGDGLSKLKELSQLAFSLSDHKNLDQIGKEGAETIKSILEKLHKLTSLSLNIDNQNIGSQINLIRRGIKSCTQLSHLNLRIHNITQEECSKFGYSLLELKNLTSFSIELLPSLENHLFPCVDDFASKLSSCKNLTNLNLIFNQNGSKIFESLGENLQRCTNLTRVNLYFQKRCQESLMKVIDEIVKCPSIITLKISLDQCFGKNVSFQKNFIHQLEKIQNLTTLELILHQQMKYYKLVSSVLNQIPKSFKIQDFHLEIDKCGVNNDQIQNMGELFIQCNKLKKVFLKFNNQQNQNCIDFGSILSLGQSLQKCDNLKQLGLTIKQHHPPPDKIERILKTIFNSCKNLAQNHIKIREKKRDKCYSIYHQNILPPFENEIFYCFNN